MKSQTNQLRKEVSAELHAQQAILLITKWVEERYPKISPLSRSRLISQCLLEVSENKVNREGLN